MEAQVKDLFQSAVAAHSRGDLARARVLYGEVLKSLPAHSDSWHLLGVIAAQSRDPARALALIGRSLELDPNNFAAHGNLGSALYALRRLPEAVAAYDRAIALKGDFVSAHVMRANVLYELQDFEAALSSYEVAITLQPDLAPAHSNRGNALQALGRLDAALTSYENALSLAPGFAEAHTNKGNVLREKGEFEAALASYERALAIDPRSVPAHFNRGVAQAQLGQPHAALASYDAALSIDADFAEARFNRALLLLMLGDFTRGWIEHEWRWRNRLGSNIKERRDFREALWRGEALAAGTTVLLYSEQGFGDTLQFCRYATLVAQRGARVLLEVPEPLASLLGRLTGVSQVITRGQALPHFDYQCPLMSLPLAFKTELDSIPGQHHYLSSDPQKKADWRKRLGEQRRPRIGLMWNGNALQPNDRNRSVWLSRWIPYFPEGFQYVSLQRDLRAADASTLAANPHIVNVSGSLRDFSDTAALCDCMDLVISVCTSVAHLSAALGKRTWILLSFAADWRWLLERLDSPWYPSVTLYRQPTRGDWDSVFERVAEDLRRAFPKAATAANGEEG